MRRRSCGTLAGGQDFGEEGGGAARQIRDAWMRVGSFGSGSCNEGGVRRQYPSFRDVLARFYCNRQAEGASPHRVCAGEPALPTWHGGVSQGRAVIRTPDQRLRVFVSSTLAELADERRRGGAGNHGARLTPVMFELGARPHPPQELYRAYLAQSDIFIGLYWQRYGWIGPDMDISGLEDEFRLSTSLPRLMYVKGPAPDREERLAELISEIEAADRLLPPVPDAGGARAARPRRPGAAAERAVRGAPRPPRRQRSRPARSLPVTSTSLIGREQDIADVVDAARRARTPGWSRSPGRAASARPGWRSPSASSWATGFAAGTVFVPLASIAEPELVLPAHRRAVGAIVEGPESPLDVVEHLGDTPSLLVLDNLEQVVAVAPEVDELLSRCPGLQIVATSRTMLRLRAEREYPVRPWRAGDPGSAVRRAGVVARRALRRPGAGRPLRLRPHRRQRRRRGRDLPPPRRPPPRHRAGGGTYPAARPSRPARPTGRHPRRPGPGPGRPPRAPAHAAGDGRVEHRPPR